jgi:hypothetical protein
MPSESRFACGQVARTDKQRKTAAAMRILRGGREDPGRLNAAGP